MAIGPGTSDSEVRILALSIYRWTLPTDVILNGLDDLFILLMFYIPVNNFSVMSGRVLSRE